MKVTDLKEAILTRLLSAPAKMILDTLTEHEQYLDTLRDGLVAGLRSRQDAHSDLSAEVTRLEGTVAQLRRELDDLHAWAQVHSKAHKLPEEPIQGSRPTPSATGRKTAPAGQGARLYCAWCGKELHGKTQHLFCGKSHATTFRNVFRGEKAEPIHRPQDAVNPPEFSAKITAGVGVQDLAAKPGNGGT